MVEPVVDEVIKVVVVPDTDVATVWAVRVRVEEGDFVIGRGRGERLWGDRVDVDVVLPVEVVHGGHAPQGLEVVCAPGHDGVFEGRDGEDRG